MNFLKGKAIGLCMSAGLFFVASGADQIYFFQFGPAWPSDINGTSWEASGGSAISLENMLDIGAEGNFLWNVESSDTTLPATQSSRQRIIEKERIKYFFFPLSAYLAVCPAPSLIVRPIIKTNVGLAMLFYAKDSLDRSNPGNYKLVPNDAGNGFYFGPYFRLSIEGLYPLGETIALHSGLCYCVSTPKKSAKGGGKYPVKMNGLGLHLGFTFKL